MTSPPADVIRQLLIDLGHGAASGDWKVFVSFLPDTPDKAICVYDTSGTFDGRVMGTGEKVEHPGIQIRLRSTDYKALWQKIEDISNDLDKQKRVSVDISSSESYLVHNVSRSAPPIPAGIEEDGDKRRHHFTINAIITIEEE